MKGGSYKTGGKHEPGNERGYNDSGSGAGAINVTSSGAGHGNNQGVNTKDDASPGGYGSSGKKSTTSPKGM